MHLDVLESSHPFLTLIRHPLLGELGLRRPFVDQLLQIIDVFAKHETCDGGWEILHGSVLQIHDLVALRMDLTDPIAITNHHEQIAGIQITLGGALGRGAPLGSRSVTGSRLLVGDANHHDVILLQGHFRFVGTETEGLWHPLLVALLRHGLGSQGGLDILHVPNRPIQRILDLALTGVDTRIHRTDLVLNLTVLSILSPPIECSEGTG